MRDGLDWNGIRKNDPNSRADYGVKYKSGRYPYGSGDNPYQHDPNRAAEGARIKQYHAYQRLISQGKTQKQIADMWGISTGTLRTKMGIAKDDLLRRDVAFAKGLRAKGLTSDQIAQRIHRSPRSVDNYLKDGYVHKASKNEQVAEVLKEQVDNRGYIYVGKGSNLHVATESNGLGKISSERMTKALDILKEQGYEVLQFDTPQMGTKHDTKITVLAPSGTTVKDLKANRDKIYIPNVYSEDGGETLKKFQEPVSVDSKRVQVLYADDPHPSGGHGIDRDGMIELRRGKDDISLGKANYAQVRIAVDGTHYLKGMAVYSDNLPDGIDIRFNSNKPKGMPVLGPDKDHSVLKLMKTGEDELNPFGATIREANDLVMAQRYYTDEKGVKHQSAINVVSEEGNWAEWKKTISAQMLSKQPPRIIERQLSLTKDIADDKLDEIMSLTNPVVRRMKLNEFAEKCDSDAVELKAIGFKDQASHVILSVPELGEKEIYAPKYEQNSSVVLVRFPHAGRFELAPLTVNNNNEAAKKILGPNPIDAVGINPKTAQILSGADFDGDTVLVIPNKDGDIKWMEPLAQLKNFEPKALKSEGGYFDPDGKYPRMTKSQTQMEMGKITNLITDITVQDPNAVDDIAKAVRHSMVVIDAEKHGLDYKQSYIDNDIAALKLKYQGSVDAGAQTLLSRSKSKKVIPERERLTNTNRMTGEELERYLEGEKIWRDTGRTNLKIDKDILKIQEMARNGKTVSEIAREVGMSERKVMNRLDKNPYSKKEATTTTTKMYYADDARELSRGYIVEELYADYANHMKALGNRARKEALSIDDDIYDSAAEKTYAKEVASLKVQLNEAKKNAPLENRAQLLSAQHMHAWWLENPDATGEAAGKEKAKAIKRFRDLVGAKKQRIVPTDKEWEAIQAGAVKKTALREILSNMDPESLTKRALPKVPYNLSEARLAKAISWARNGRSQQQIADVLGVSVSTINKILMDYHVEVRE